jgi:hypothetical protein
VQRDPALAQLFHGAATIGVVSKRRKEIDLRSQLRQDTGHDPATARGARKRIAGVDHLPRLRQARDGDEFDPLDMPHDRETHRRTVSISVWIS